MVGLEAQLRYGGAQLRQPGGGLLFQLGADHVAVRGVVVDGRTVGQHHRRAEGEVLLLDLGGEGAVGAAGGHGEGPALPGEVAQGRVVGLRHSEIAAV